MSARPKKTQVRGHFRHEPRRILAHSHLLVCAVCAQRPCAAARAKTRPLARHAPGSGASASRCQPGRRRRRSEAISVTNRDGFLLTLTSLCVQCVRRDLVRRHERRRDPWRVMLRGAELVRVDVSPAEEDAGQRPFPSRTETDSCSLSPPCVCSVCAETLCGGTSEDATPGASCSGERS